MTRKEQQRVQVLNQVLAGHWSAEQAAEVLQVSVRHLLRLKAAYQQGGPAALVHGNRGRTPVNKLSQDLAPQVLALVGSRYADCNDSHLVELLALREGLVLSRQSLRRLLRRAGLPPARPRRAPRHRRRRDRMPQEGMLLQVDGSPHQWLGPEQPRCSLLGAIDDASSKVVGAVFREQEDAHGYLLVLGQVLQRYGVPDALYHDRHGIFQRDPKAPWTLDEELQGRKTATQFGQALEQLHIGSIAARSPQAKGRIERLWGTLQDRLVVELRLADIQTLAAANAFLPSFLERYNVRFAVKADHPGQAYRPLDANLDLDQVLSFRYPRVVGNDNTVRFAGQALQLPPGPKRRSYAKAHVLVHELLDGSLGVWYEGQWLLRMPALGHVQAVRARKSGPERPPAPIPPTPTMPAKPVSFRDSNQPPRPAPDHPWRRSFKRPLRGGTS